jgi:hypothetical protein
VLPFLTLPANRPFRLTATTTGAIFSISETGRLHAK